MKCGDGLFLALVTGLTFRPRLEGSTFYSIFKCQTLVKDLYLEYPLRAKIGTSLAPLQHLTERQLGGEAHFFVHDNFG